MGNVDVREQRHEQQEFLSRDVIDGHQPKREHQVEVEASQVRSHPGPPPETVVVRHVGIEGGVHQIESDAHTPHSPSAVTQRRGVAQFVEGGG